MGILLKAALVHVLIILNNGKENVLHEELLYFPIMFSYTSDTQKFPFSINNAKKHSVILKNPGKEVLSLCLCFHTTRFPNL